MSYKTEEVLINGTLCSVSYRFDFRKNKMGTDFIGWVPIDVHPHEKKHCPYEAELGSCSIQPHCQYLHGENPVARQPHVSSQWDFSPRCGSCGCRCRCDATTSSSSILPPLSPVQRSQSFPPLPSSHWQILGSPGEDICSRYVPQ